ncbi:MAG: alpha/beta fold hydrolase [Myxococcota bacterium]
MAEPSDAPREHVVEGHDGWRLNVLELEPVGEPKAVVLLGHAMLVDRRTLWRPGRRTLGNTLVQNGLRVLIPEMRGRGLSGPTPAEGADWTYDDHVRDTEAYIGLARRLAPSLPLFLVGHSLFAHTSLAYLGQHPELPVRGAVGLGMNIWNRRWQPSRLMWLGQRLHMATGLLIVALFGYLPGRRLRMGSADESRSYSRQFGLWTSDNFWGSLDGVDYHANLAKIEFPFLHVVSDGDRWSGRPDQALRFTAILGDRREVLHLGPTCSEPILRGLLPSHMTLVTDPRSEPLWRVIADWIVTKAGVG